MNLVQIKDYPNYSFNLNSNQVYSHYKKDYLKPKLQSTGYYQITLCKNGKVKIFVLHRLVYEAHYGEIPTGLCIDHINNDRQNNNITNLRLATLSQNQHNQKVHKNNKSGYKNIFLTKYNTYTVNIQKNRKVVYYKTFKTLEEAIENRDIQLLLIHKEFHNLG